MDFTGEGTRGDWKGKSDPDWRRKEEKRGGCVLDCHTGWGSSSRLLRAGVGWEEVARGKWAEEGISHLPGFDGPPGLLQSVGWQRVSQDLATEQQQIAFLLCSAIGWSSPWETGPQWWLAGGFQNRKASLSSVNTPGSWRSSKAHTPQSVSHSSCLRELIAHLGNVLI